MLERLRPAWRPLNPLVLPAEMLIATLIYAGFQLSTGMIGDTRTELTSSPGLITITIVALLAMAAVTCVRRSFPVTSYLAVVAISVGLILILPDRTLGFTPLYWFAIAALAIRRSGARLFVPLTIGLLLEITISVHTRLSFPDASAGPGGIAGVVLEQAVNLAINYTVLIALGKYIARNRTQEIASEAALDQARRDHRQRLADALEAERRTMARELHDVAAHHLTGMLIQAKGSQTLIPNDPERARELLNSAIGHGQKTLDSLRQIVGILRPTEHSLDTPQPMISDIPELVEQSALSFASVDFEVEDGLGEVDSAVQLTCFRVVQEALSNARRHAADSIVHVHVVSQKDSVEVIVRNTLDEARTADPTDRGLWSHGFGIAGMHERAALLGGTLTAEATPDGTGWVVHARLPLGGKIATMSGSLP